MVINDDTVGVRSFRSGISSVFDRQRCTGFIHEDIIGGSHLSGAFDGKLTLVDDLLFADSQSNIFFLKVDDSRFLDRNLAARFRNFRQIIMIPYIDVATVFQEGNEAFQFGPAILNNAIHDQFSRAYVSCSEIGSPPAHIFIGEIAGCYFVCLFIHLVVAEFHDVLVVSVGFFRHIYHIADKCVGETLLHSIEQIAVAIGIRILTFISIVESNAADRAALDEHVALESLEITDKAGSLRTVGERFGIKYVDRASSYRAVADRDIFRACADETDQAADFLNALNGRILHMTVFHRTVVHAADQCTAAIAGHFGTVDREVFHVALKHIEETAVVSAFIIRLTCGVVNVEVLDRMAGAVEFHEAFAFRIDRSPRAIGSAFKVDIGRQHDSGTLALGNQVDRFFQRSDIACSISRNSSGSFLECNFRNRTVDLYVAFYDIQFRYFNAFGHDQRIVGRRGVYFPEGAVQDNRRFRGVDGQFSGGIGRNSNVGGSFRVTLRSTGLIVVFYGNGVARFGQRKRNFHVIVRSIDLRYHDLVARCIRQILDDDIGRTAFESRLDISRAFYFRNHFLNGAFRIEIRIDRHADRSFLGQQVARYIGAVVASDGNVGEGVVGADFRAVVEERHREIGERGLGFRGPEEVHRDRAVVFGQLFRRIGHVGRTAHFARQGVERRGHSLESDLVSRGLQRLVLDFVQVVGLYHQQAERTLQGDVVSREGTIDGNSLVVEERVALVAVAHELAFLRDGFQTARYSVVYFIVETFLTA